MGARPSFKVFLTSIAAAAFVALAAPVAGESWADETLDRQSLSENRLAQALDILAHVPAGRELLARAQKFWGISRRADLGQVLVWGKASKTDAVLTRHFDPKTGSETRDRQVTIYLKQNQPLEDLVLDLSHELVHATARPTWDPYDPKLTAGRYIWAAIEGEGGEVDAVLAECRVSFELLDRYGTAVGPSRRCQNYLTPGAAPVLSADLVRRDFYRVGRWHSDLARELRPELKLFPLLSPETPKLYSSTGNSPYPASLIREFHEITQIACENSRRRVTQAGRRGPASGSASGPNAADLQVSVSSFLSSRCAEPSP